MSVLTYGGIALSILKTHNIACEAVYDDTGLDLLWLKYTFDVTGVVNTAATSFSTAVANPQPVAGAGNPPFLTVRDIRDTLALPRQLLTYADENGNIMVRSPARAPVLKQNFVPGAGFALNAVPLPTTLDCDCDGGPKPLRPAEVLQVHGQGKSIIVRFAVSCTVNDSIFWTAQGGLALLGGGSPKPPILLSNRWTTNETIDEAAWSTRTYTGRAAFRADLMRDYVVTPTDGSGKRLAVPDDFRRNFASFFIPSGFQRRQVWVEQEPSGFTVRYRVTDVQLPVTLVAGKGAAKIDAVWVGGTSRRGAEDLAHAGAMATAEYGMDILGGISIDPIKSKASVLAASLRYGLRMAELAYDALPRTSDRFILTATGQPGSNRADLLKILYRIWLNYLTVNDFFWCGTQIYITADLMGKWVRMEVTMDRGPIRSTVVSTNGPSGIPDYRTILPADDGITGVSSSTPGKQPPLPNDGGVRGTALEWMVAQSLMYPYNEAPSPGGHSQAGQGLPLP